MTRPDPTDNDGRELADAAGFVRRHGLEIPALFLLEMQKPLARFCGHGAEMVRPLLPAPWRDRLRPFERILTDPDRIESLIHRIESAPEPLAQERAADIDTAPLGDSS